MKRRDVERRLIASGFTREVTDGGTRFIRQGPAGPQLVAVDNVRGSAWRVWLAVGAAPSCWPAVDGSRREGRWREAESPWFDYVLPDAEEPEDAGLDYKDQALAKCAVWLTSVGFLWLASPEALSETAWRKEHNLLVKQQGGSIAG